ncbi:MAG: DUF126 domain-containing protein [Anaerolineales bacterium]
MILTGRVIYPGKAQGIALVSHQALSFFGGVDPENGIVLESGHELEGQLIANKILVFPSGKGSTVGSYTLYRLKQNGLAPAAILNAECEPIIATGCIISEIPCIDRIEIAKIPNNAYLFVNGENGVVEIAQVSPQTS